METLMAPISTDGGKLQDAWQDAWCIANSSVPCLGIMNWKPDATAEEGCQLFIEDQFVYS